MRRIIIRILCKILKFIEELIMKLIPNICGSNRLHLPSICEDVETFVGIDDVTLIQGDDFNPIEGVIAYDENDNIVPFDVTPSSIDTCVVGTYTFTYSTEHIVRQRKVTVNQASAPTISGLTSLTVDVGDAFNTLQGVSAVDAHGNAITVTCLEGAAVTFNEGGQQILHYTAEDACGNVANATRNVYVQIGHFEGVQNATMAQGTDFDLTSGVKAYTASGTEVPFTVTPNEVIKCEVGEQTFTYTADKVQTVERTVTVTAIGDPTINGISESITVGEGVEFDPLDGVTATDGNGNTLTVTVTLVQGA